MMQPSWSWGDCALPVAELGEELRAAGAALG